MLSASITRREWRYVCLFAVFVIVLFSLPYLIGLYAQRPDLRFGGILVTIEDVNSYFAKMRQGALVDWLFINRYTTEPHPTSFVYVFYIALGHLTRVVVAITHIPLTDALVIVYHLARIVCSTLLIGVLYKFIAHFLPSFTTRCLALVLICLGSGVGWLLALLGQQYWLGTLPVDLLIPEAFSFYQFYTLPHLLLARASLLAGFIYLFTALREQQIKYAVGASICWLVTALCIPIHALALYAVLGAWGLALWIWQRGFPWMLFKYSLVGILLSALYVLYNGYVIFTNPVIRQWQAQNVLPTPSPLHFIAAYGLLSLGALPAIFTVWRSKKTDNTYTLLVMWLIITPVLIYFPSSIQRRFIEGAYICLCILAVWGLYYEWPRHVYWLKSQAIRRWMIAGVLLIVLPTYPLILLGNMVQASMRYPALYHSLAELTALDWIAQHTSDNANVLANFNLSNYIPVRTNARVYLGHLVETIDSTRKAAQVEKFLALNGMSMAERSTFVNAHQIDYVILGPSESQLAGELLASQSSQSPSPFELVYLRDGYSIFRINRA